MMLGPRPTPAPDKAPAPGRPKPRPTPPMQPTPPPDPKRRIGAQATALLRRARAVPRWLRVRRATRRLAPSAVDLIDVRRILDGLRVPALPERYGRHSLEALAANEIDGITAHVVRPGEHDLTYRARFDRIIEAEWDTRERRILTMTDLQIGAMI